MFMQGLIHKTISLIIAWYYSRVFMSATNNVFRREMYKAGHKMYITTDGYCDLYGTSFKF